MLKHNLTYADGSFDDYRAYLETIRDRLPEPLFDFARDPSRHDFSSRSLHDSWVKSVGCTTDFETGEMQLTLLLTGDQFDREFRLRFEGVTQYSVTQSDAEIDRDLISFEIGVEEDRYGEERLVFRVVFSGERDGIEIFAKNFTIEEVLIGADNS